ncbi:hypothetical protein HK097_000347 [Rhizophlyctis rosea]|uniref:Ketopantoate reductase C-terminal domain-containing protein n=1 Tax=Rhizophlyctis rosea TaxID=64517 RepID=A0AAD5S8N0_9FUNG|nr:hypothetical protein HK097_000347 [Rhizophlyctis rosea]
MTVGQAAKEVWEVIEKTRKNRSSMFQDVAAGKPDTEIDYINGYIVRQASKYGIDVPTNKVIVDLIKMKSQAAYAAAVAARSSSS